MARFFGDYMAGQFKLILQFYVVLMALFNTLTLLNSDHYARMIAERNYIDLNKKLKSEMRRLAFAWLLFVGFLISVSYAIRLDEILNLHLTTIKLIIPYIVLSFSFIFFGPVNQFLIHSRKITVVIRNNFLRLLYQFLAFVIFSYVEDVPLMGYVAGIAVIELIIMLLATSSLRDEMYYRFPLIR